MRVGPLILHDSLHLADYVLVGVADKIEDYLLLGWVVRVHRLYQLNSASSLPFLIRSLASIADPVGALFLCSHLDGVPGLHQLNRQRRGRLRRRNRRFRRSIIELLILVRIDILAHGIHFMLIFTWSEYYKNIFENHMVISLKAEMLFCK